VILASLSWKRARLAGVNMNQDQNLVALSEAAREQALARFHILEPFLTDQVSLSQISRIHGIPLRTVQRWAANYRRGGLTALARKPRSDRGQRRVAPELQGLIEGLALQKTRPSVAAIHRQAAQVASSQGWSIPSYRCVYDIVHSLEPGMVTLAHEGSKAYQNAYDLVHRREANRPNAIWQADHSPLDIYLLNDAGQPAKPWLTIVEDDYSRCVAGYFLAFTHPNVLNTALTLRQAIWRKSDPRWRICGIPEVFYTDHGSDFTSQHLEQVCADLECRLIFSTVGMPRGRGRIERFFQTVDQLLLVQLPGYAPKGGSHQSAAKPVLTLEAFDEIFRTFLLDEYHLRPQRELAGTPQERWEQGPSGCGFLPRMPDSLEELDLLLLTVAKTRRVHRDGIRFQSLRYIAPILADYVGEEVIIRYDPRDLAEIRVYHGQEFIGLAICQELSGMTVSLQEIVRARNQRRRQMRKGIRDREDLLQTYLKVHQAGIESHRPKRTRSKSAHSSTRRLKQYANE